MASSTPTAASEYAAGSPALPSPGQPGLLEDPSQDNTPTSPSGSLGARPSEPQHHESPGDGLALVFGGGSV